VEDPVVALRRILVLALAVAETQKSENGWIGPLEINWSGTETIEGVSVMIKSARISSWVYRIDTFWI
jgi:hypothetical protein